METNEATMLAIKEILEKRTKEFVIDELLRAYWQNPRMLNSSSVWREYLEELEIKNK